MRYLFGDSTPFPLPFDFLRTLEAFMTAGTRVVLLEHGARRVHAEVIEEREANAKGLSALEAFHDNALRAFIVPPTEQGFVLEYGKRMTERATQLLDARRKDCEAAAETGAARVAIERERANEEAYKHLATFFQTARLPTLDARVTTSLEHGRPVATAMVVHPGGVGASFTLGTARAPAWQTPRRVGDLAGHLELMVGIKKSWIGGKVSLEPLRLDDWVIGAAEVGETTARIALRKRADQKDALVFTMNRDGGTLHAEVSHPGDPNAAQVPTEAEEADLPQLDRLWTALREAFEEILEERAAVTAITLDGAPAMSRGLGQDLVERLVGVLAPTTLEIAKRSPNASELSLKREGDDGRREEFYLKRAELCQGLQPLPAAGRAVFAPLGLDEWVPSMTMRPPEVAVAAPIDEPSSVDIEDLG